MLSTSTKKSNKSKPGGQSTLHNYPIPRNRLNADVSSRKRVHASLGLRAAFENFAQIEPSFIERATQDGG